jgi:hypothetical protein
MSQRRDIEPREEFFAVQLAIQTLPIFTAASHEGCSTGSADRFGVTRQWQAWRRRGAVTFWRLRCLRWRVVVTPDTAINRA